MKATAASAASSTVVISSLPRSTSCVPGIAHRNSTDASTANASATARQNGLRVSRGTRAAR